MPGSKSQQKSCTVLDNSELLLSFSGGRIMTVQTGLLPADPVREQVIEPFLFLYITEKCQLRCKHCYMGERLDAERYMTPELVEEILSSLRTTYGQYKVYILGGEPTQHPQLANILDVCKSQSYKVVITSNGLITEPSWKILTRDRIDSFSFSMDGSTAQTHESMRGNNTFKPLIKSIKRAVEEGFQTRIIYTVTTENISDTEIALDMAEELGLEMVSFHYFTPTGNGQNSPHLQLTPSQWMKFCATLREQSRKRQVRIFYPPAFVQPEELLTLPRQGYRGCTARNLERFAIFPDRRVYICSAFFDTDLHYGIFENGQIVPRLDQTGNNELTLVNKVSGNCRGCSYGAACRGGCAAYDYFERTLTSDSCDREVIPVCPLWSVPAIPSGTEHRLRDLR
jgi:radical SAM protein with 4Fe4S-binding SPASM domain